MLPPKFGIMEDVNDTEIQIQMEEAMNKLRWNRFIPEDGRSQVGFYDEQKKSMNENNLHVTSFPLNPSVTIPRALSQQEEIKIHKFKQETMEAVKDLKNKC